MIVLEMLRHDVHYSRSSFRQQSVTVYQHLRQFTKDEPYLAVLNQEAPVVLFEKALALILT